MKDFSSSLIRSAVGWNPNGPKEVHRLLFRPQRDAFIYVEAGELVAYSATREQLAELETCLLGYVEAELVNRPKFILINVHAGGAAAHPVELDQFAEISSEELPLYYGHDFPEWERPWLQRMKHRPAGLSILSGPTGTGKTTFLRSLVRRFSNSDTHCFYYVPASFAAVLTSPEYVSFWVGQNQSQMNRQKVVILEDAEDLLLKRDEASRSRVSNLLNVTDGFLADQLRLQVIATVNCPLGELDPAIVRPGRLIGYRHFRRLTRHEAAQLAAKKGVSLLDQEDYSLAEIFVGKAIAPTAIPQRQLGYTR